MFNNTVVAVTVDGATPPVVANAAPPQFPSAASGVETTESQLPKVPLPLKNEIKAYNFVLFILL